jgi:hypothetical protein
VCGIIPCVYVCVHGRAHIVCEREKERRESEREEERAIRWDEGGRAGNINRERNRSAIEAHLLAVYSHYTHISI